MKNLLQIVSLCALAAVLLAASGCVQDQRYVRRNHISRAPYIGSPEWITWVDLKVDARYSNGIRPDPGSQEWYAIVDHVVFADYSHDYYRNVYREEYRNDSRRYYGEQRPTRYARRPAPSNYYGPARFSSTGSGRSYYGDYRLGSVEWRRAVTARILSGEVPAAPPRTDPWDAPLSPTH